MWGRTGCFVCVGAAMIARWCTAISSRRVGERGRGEGQGKARHGKGWWWFAGGPIGLCGGAGRPSPVNTDDTHTPTHNPPSSQNHSRMRLNLVRRGPLSIPRPPTNQPKKITAGEPAPGGAGLRPAHQGHFFVFCLVEGGTGMDGNGWAVGWVDGWVDGWIDARTHAKMRPPIQQDQPQKSTTTKTIGGRLWGGRSPAPAQQPPPLLWHAGVSICGCMYLWMYVLYHTKPIPYHTNSNIYIYTYILPHAYTNININISIGGKLQHTHLLQSPTYI